MSTKTNAQLDAAVDVAVSTNGANENTGQRVRDYLKDVTDSKVSMTDNETVGGVKTFSSFPVTPSSTPANNYDVANKKYVDDNTGDTSLWEVVSGETRLKTADVINMRGEEITGLDEPSAQSSAVTVQYLEEYVESKILKVTTTVTSAQIDTLGTVPVEVVPACGGNKYIRVIGADIKVIPVTTLDVNYKGLLMFYAGDYASGYIRKFATGAVQSATVIRQDGIVDTKTITLREDEAIQIAFEDSTNPDSGEATFVFNITYEILDY